MEELFNKCNICPRECNVNRNKGEIGYCGASNKIKIGGYHLHMWEEPIITGKNGSGTIFFSYCNLRCIYCQNYDISINNNGEEISIERFSDICLLLQEMGAENINLVTPSHYIPLIREGLIMAKRKGLIIPIVYNTSGYDKVNSLKLLDGLIDIYLPDFKYYDKELNKYSNVNNYFEITSEALKEMYRQTGKAIFDDRGIMKKGMIIRHLVLPNHILNSRRVLKWINDNMNDVYVSVMAQYFPTYKAKEIEDINRKLKKEEYEQIENYLYRLNLENGYIQELGEHEEEYVPKWEM